MSKQSTDDTERSTCHKCGRVEDERNPLIEVRIPLTDEYWMLCDPCIDDMVDWLDTEIDQ